MVVAEGRRLVADVLLAGAPVVAVLATEDAARESAKPLLESAESRGVEVAVVTQRAFDELADTETPSGILAVVRWSPGALDAMPAGRRILVIDGVQDPGNVGTMIRTAHALGVDFTVALDGTADVRAPKVVRGAMGALFRHAVAQATFDELAGAWRDNCPATFLAAQDGEPLAAVAASVPPRVAIVIGSEGRGVRAEWSTGWIAPTRRVTVPMREGAESLNAAVAAGIILYELTRES